MASHSLASHPYLSASRFHEWLEMHVIHQGVFEHKKGCSILTKPIYHLMYGKGDVHMMLWSQMHGNEATATYSLSDIFLEIIESKGLWKHWAERFTFHFIPMLNPDGSEAFTRHNALGSDMNREAIRPISPEIEFLQNIAKEYPIQWAFNLHDQRDIFSVGHSPKPATIALLAPQSITEQGKNSREQVKQVLGKILKDCPLNKRGYVARFNDEYYPRALGEYFQNQGINTVLIESGGHPHDPLREQARHYTKYYIEQALEIIAQGNAGAEDSQFYEACPMNQESLRNLIIRSAKCQIGDRIFEMDIALMKKAQVKEGHYSEKWIINEVGDLRHLFGYKEIIKPESIFSLKDGAYLPETEFSLEHLPKELLTYF